MWELDYKESWALKNWCFWTVVLEKTLESLLDCKEIQPVHPKGNQSRIFTGRPDTEAATPILWPPDVKKWLIWKDPMLGKIKGERRRGQQRMRWLDGITNLMDMSEQALGDGEGQGSLACCSPWGHKESDMTQQLNSNRFIRALILSGRIFCYVQLQLASLDLWGVQVWCAHSLHGRNKMSFSKYSLFILL